MSIIQDIIKATKANQTINSFFSTHYKKPPKHYLGYKRSPKPEELPCLCYIPVKSQIEEIKPSSWTISIIVMLDDSGLLDENLSPLNTAMVVNGESQLFAGAVRSEEAQALLTNFLMELDLTGGAVIVRDFKITNDMTLNFPFFQSEIKFEVSAINY